MLRGALHIAVIVSFLWLPLNRRHNIVLVYPIEDVGLRADGLLLNATMQSNGVTAAKWKPFLKAVIAKICAASATPVGFIFMGADAKKLAGAVTAAHVVVQCDFPGQWTGGAAALDTARPFQAIDNALQAAGAPRIQWDVLLR